ncbi:MAG: YigZ family protein [Flavobacteriales bacterium]|nr:YigZ family protein [Flavobacteriales bacterium]
MSEASDTYLSLKGRSESLYKVKGSKHFGYAFSVRNEDEIKAFLEVVKKEHHAARHHCYAWRLGHDKKRYRANDDGEPSNSAGKPILGQIQSYDLTNVLIVVVRYFGGVKLGVGGLIDAYRTSAREAIEAGSIIELLVEDTIKVDFPYEAMGSVMKILKDYDLEMITHEFEFKCTLTTSVRQSLTEELLNAFNDLDFVKASAEA